MAVAIAGVVCAALIDRAGHRMAGLLTCALTGLLCSPISWDHHWVWIVPGAVVAAVYAVRARGARRWALAGLAAGLVLVFGAWPGSLWHLPADTGGYFEGLIWVPPLTNPETYLRIGDQPWYAEYHWHGLQLIFGNLYVLTGMALFAALLVAGFGPAVRAAAGFAKARSAHARNGCPRPLRRPADPSSTGRSGPARPARPPRRAAPQAPTRTRCRW